MTLSQYRHALVCLLFYEVKIHFHLYKPLLDVERSVLMCLKVYEFGKNRATGSHIATPILSIQQPVSETP